MTAEYRKGGRVRVVVEGVVSHVSTDPADAILVDVGAGVRTAEIPIGAPGVTVERLAPPEPAVVAGRVYRDNTGTIVYAIATDHIRVVWPDGLTFACADIPARCLPLTQVWPPLDAESEWDAEQVVSDDMDRITAAELDRAVVEAAKAWRGRIQDPPNSWADECDLALIAAVDAAGGAS